MTNAIELITAVRHMRTCQKNYFRTRAQDWLQQSKQYERIVDDMLADMRDEAAKKSSLTLFDTPAASETSPQNEPEP